MRAVSRREELHDQEISIFIGGTEALGGCPGSGWGGGFDGGAVDRGEPQSTVRVVSQVPEGWGASGAPGGPATQGREPECPATPSSVWRWPTVVTAAIGWSSSSSARKAWSSITSASCG